MRKVPRSEFHKKRVDTSLDEHYKPDQMIKTDFSWLQFIAVKLQPLCYPICRAFYYLTYYQKHYRYSHITTTYHSLRFSKLYWHSKYALVAKVTCCCESDFSGKLVAVIEVALCKRFPIHVFKMIIKDFGGCLHEFSIIFVKF